VATRQWGPAFLSFSRTHKKLDSRFRGNDENGKQLNVYAT